MKLKMHLSFTSLREALSSCFNKIPEHRQANKVDYSIHDALMSGFACMHFQDASLLQYQKRLEKKHHKSNLQTLFGMKRIPESTQLRAITDGVDSGYLGPFFEEFFYRLQRGKHLLPYQLFKDEYLISLDATEYFSSYKTSCACCLKTKSIKKKGKSSNSEENNDDIIAETESEEKVTRYAHKVLQVALMHPAMKQVIPLMPEEICNTDGATKQDCETNAAKRLLPKIRKAHPQLGIILAGDDLFSRQPMIEAVLAGRMHYIFVAKPSSHTYLMEWLAAYPKLHTHEVMDRKKGVRHVYQWMNDVPIHGGKDAIRTNYFIYQQISKDDVGKERINYQNSWVTDIIVNADNVEKLSSGGRCRWKIENETFNTLKNQGYCIEHSYGHGENLTFNFYLLTLIAFSFHQILELTDKLFQTCRKHFGSKKNLWDHLRAYVRIMLFDTWEHLLSFTLDPEDYLAERCPSVPP